MQTATVQAIERPLVPMTADTFVGTPAPRAMTLRQAMIGREGEVETESAIRRGLFAWAVERYTGSEKYRRRETTMVFGRNASDALRRASAPARLGEEIDGDETHVARIRSGWDEPAAWPGMGTRA